MQAHFLARKLLGSARLKAGLGCQVRKLSGVTRSDEPVSNQDAYAELAPDPVVSPNDGARERDWFSEFPDESRSRVVKPPQRLVLGGNVDDEHR